jgi:hypothetical protein
MLLCQINEVSTGSVGSADILSASGRSPLPASRENSFSKEFALRAQADRMSALPTAPAAVRNDNSKACATIIPRAKSSFTCR